MGISTSRKPEGSTAGDHVHDQSNTGSLRDIIAGAGSFTEDETDPALYRVKPQARSDLQMVDADNPSTPSHRTYSKAGTTRDGGFLGFRRAKLVLDIMKKAGGAFPGGYEMWYPFAPHWKRLYQQIPDRSTVEHAVAGLVKDGKLKRFAFTFMDKDGEQVQKACACRNHTSMQPLRKRSGCKSR